MEEQVRKSDRLAGLRLYVHKNNGPAKRAYESRGMAKDRYELYEWLK